MLEDRGFHGEEAILALTRAYVTSVLQHPREKDGRLRMPAPPRPPRAVEELASLLRSRGVPEHLIAEQVRKMLASSQPSRSRRRGK